MTLPLPCMNLSRVRVFSYSFHCCCHLSPSKSDQLMVYQTTGNTCQVLHVLSCTWLGGWSCNPPCCSWWLWCLFSSSEESVIRDNSHEGQSDVAWGVWCNQWQVESPTSAASWQTLYVDFQNTSSAYDRHVRSTNLVDHHQACFCWEPVCWPRLYVN